MSQRPIAGRGVDVATGHVTFVEEDLALPGPPALAIARTYVSGDADRGGPLGRGWSLSIDQRVTLEHAAFAWRDGAGRELVFLHDGAPRAGLPIGHPLDGARLVWLGRGMAQVLDGPRRLTFEALADGASELHLRSIEVGTASAWIAHEAGLPVAVTVGALRARLAYADGRLRALSLELPAGEVLPIATYEHDREGQLARVRLPQGLERGYEYVRGLCVTRVFGDGERVHFGYDDGGPDAKCLRTWSDAGYDDRTLSYRYGASTVATASGDAGSWELDPLFRVTKSPRGTWRYDPERLAPVEARSRYGRRVAMLDAAGRPAEIRAPDGTVARYTFDDAGRVVQRVDGAGTEARVRYAGERVVERAGDGPSVSVRDRDDATEIVVGDEWLEVERDGAGRPARVRLRDQEWRVDHDALGRPAALDGPDGRRRFAHDAYGRLVGVEVDGARASFARDAEGRLVQAVLPDGEWVIERDRGGLPRLVTRPDFACELRFDRERRLTEVIDRRGRRWVFTRDRAGRVVEELDFDHRAYGYKYAGASADVSTLVLPGGERLAVYRDAAGRVAEARYGTEVEERFAYDAAGRLVEAWREDRVVALARDRAGNVVGERQANDEVGASYDACGRRALVVSSVGARITRTWGASGGRLIEVVAPDGSRHEVRLERGRLVSGALDVPRAPREPPLRFSGEGDVERDAAGRIAAWTAPDGRRWAYRYGVDGLVAHVELPGGDVLAYTYDALGRRVAATSARFDARWIWDGGVALHELSSMAPPRLYVFDPGDGAPIGRVDPGHARWLGLYQDFVSLFDPAQPDRPTSEYWAWRGGLFIDLLTGLWLGPGRAYHPRAAEPMGASTISDELFGPASLPPFEYAPRVLSTLERASDAELSRFLHRLTTPAWLELPRTPPAPWPAPIEPPSLWPEAHAI